MPPPMRRELLVVEVPKGGIAAWPASGEDGGLARENIVQSRYSERFGDSETGTRP